MFRKSIVFAAFVAFALPAVAQAEQAPANFVRDAFSYSYVTIQRDGYKILQGTADGAPFRLTVNERTVRGTVNGRAVEFPLKTVPRASAATELAQR